MLLAPVVLKILTTRACGAQEATCSAAEVSNPWVSPERFGASGLVQSKTILPARPPALFTASWVAPQGVARTTTSAPAAASATDAALAPVSSTSFFTLGSEASRTPNVTSCPARAQPRPRAPPTLPAPMIPIFISHLLVDPGYVIVQPPPGIEIPGPCTRRVS